MRNTSVESAPRTAGLQWVIAWDVSLLVLAIAGFLVLLTFQRHDNLTAVAPSDWPVGSGLERAAARPTLLVFVSGDRAQWPPGVAALQARLAQREGAIDTWLVIHPAPNNPAHEGGLPRTAADQTWGRHYVDTGGEEAARFGAILSGQALLYDPHGRCVFRGQLTDLPDAASATLETALDRLVPPEV